MTRPLFLSLVLGIGLIAALWLVFKGHDESLRQEPTPQFTTEAHPTLTEKITAGIITTAYAQESQAKPIKTRETDLGFFALSSYYTPVPGQARYLNGWKKGKEGQCATDNLTWRQGTGSFSADSCINGSGDLFVTTDGTNLKHVAIYTSAACPRNMLGWKLKVDGLGVVTCNDTGGSITKGRLDIWVGWGDEGITNYLKHTVPGTARVYRIL